MRPTWLLILSGAALVIGLASTALIVVDFVRGYRQPARLLELVWAVTALYFGPGAVIAYGKWGRPQSLRWRERYGNPPKRNEIVLHLCYCGVHCTLGTIIATVPIDTIGLDVAGETRWPGYIADYFAAVAVALTFRYFAESRRVRLRLWAAIRSIARADLLTVSIFELALIVWLILLGNFVFPAPLLPNDPTFWFILQIGLIIGFALASPHVVWRIHRGATLRPSGA